ncbi:MAG: chromosomal replication initiator protein, partial [Gaiellaceae bacterium]|nr:chromosomal replication initiator protein [Gaiellaceae bacterium]
MERQIELTADSLWNDVAARLREALNDTTFQTWFGEVGGAEIDGDLFAIAVPNDFTREWIEGHFLSLISAALEDATGRELRIALKVRDTPTGAGPSPLPPDLEHIAPAA